MILEKIDSKNSLRQAITDAYLKDETIAVNEVIKAAFFPREALAHIHEMAKELIKETRRAQHKKARINAFLHKYDLSSSEGIALMCIAEALLRIPDSYTQNLLISDKISTANWSKHLKRDDTLLMRALTLSLMLVGKFYSPLTKPNHTWQQLLSQMGCLALRPLVLQGMKIIGKQFVMATTIEEALVKAHILEKKGYRYSYDMLGEAARTRSDAEKYFNAYLHAIYAIGNHSKNVDPIQGPGISIKLSALHPRYEVAKQERVMKELIPRLLQLTQAAAEQNIGLVIDAEEAERLELSLDIIETIFKNPIFKNWTGFGLAVQSYQKRAPLVIEWLAHLAKETNRRIMIRLIKGAYWDYEIKRAQVLGLKNYPVYTRKHATDVSFLACAKQMMAYHPYIYPQFGTHNAYSVAAILELMGANRDFEFQCLHGMGEPLYDQIVQKNILTRIYAPIGTHKDLLGYLVRRLLENGANTSFINQIADENSSIEKVIVDPVSRMANLAEKPHPHIPLPRHLYHERLNSEGLDLTNMNTLKELKEKMEKADQHDYEAGPIINGHLIKRNPKKTIFSPGDLNFQVGCVYETTFDDIEVALSQTQKEMRQWANVPVEKRAAILDEAALLFEKNLSTFMTLLCREGGKQIADCLSEIRETIDYCRYYSARARIACKPEILKGPTGEYNELSLHARGIIACISPWNFPLAIFSGQILAALVTGNAVIAKPAEQTPLVAALAVQLLHEAGIPKNILQLLPGEGGSIGAKLIGDPRINGVMFTGSTETAKQIQQTLTDRPGPMVPFIAETGGQNVMIVDSSALPEQVVLDIMTSAFNSAGQRCSALRVLFVQEDIAETLITMLKNAMVELKMGDPSLLETDIGPVIDEDAKAVLTAHFKKMQVESKLLYQVPLPQHLNGYYFPPAAFELKNLNLLQREVFGPILHILRYSVDRLDDVLESIVATGYGLTLGIHSRIDATVNYITQKVSVGNIYVNRNMIGAVVGVQPFGGERLSGTGPKAGGPYYLPRLCVERTISINTTAAGGNATLVSLKEDD